MQTVSTILLAIDQALRSGDMDAATRLSCQALQQGHVHPLPLSLRARWHEKEGRPGAAIADLRQLQAIAGDGAVIHIALGRCLTALGRGAEALPHLAGALALAPGNEEAWYEKGMALEQQGDLNGAGAAFGHAAKLVPTGAAIQTDAIARLAALAARRSDWPQARALADQALAARPDNPIALTAHIMADLAERDFAAAEHRAIGIIQSHTAPPQARATAWSFRGDAMDGEGRTAEAFAAHAEANRELKALFRGRFENRETGGDLAQRIVRHMQQTAPSSGPSEAADPAPVFLLGFPRSGASLLGQILAGHSRLVVLDEKPLMNDAIQEFFGAPDGLEKLQALSPEQTIRHRARYWEHVRQESAAGWEGRQLIDQTPLNILHLPLIAKLFPGAKIIFALRDPRDVALSCFRRLFALNRYTYEFLSLSRTAKFYDRAMQLQTLAREKLPLDFHDIRNEDLVADFKSRGRELCAFLGLEWEPQMAGFAEASKARGVATPSATQIARGLSQDGIGQWRRYEDQLRAVMPLLAPWARAFGYTP